MKSTWSLRCYHRFGSTSPLIQADWCNIMVKVAFIVVVLFFTLCNAEDQEPLAERVGNVDYMVLGAGAHWSVPAQSLFWVDVRGAGISKLERSTGNVIRIKTNEKNHPVGFIMPVKGKPDHFVIGEKLSLVLIRWDTKANKIISREVLATLDEPQNHRISDGAKCDANGRLWFGTTKDSRAPEQEASFYSYSPREGLKTHIKGTIRTSGGIAISADNKKMWYIDMGSGKIQEYGFDIRAGKLTKAKVLVNIETLDVPHRAMLAGMTIDSDDNLWVAIFRGNKVLKISTATGDVLKTLEFPKAAQISSASFGGPDLDELYVTSANAWNEPKVQKMYPESGSLFRVTRVGSEGVPEHEFALSPPNNSECPDSSQAKGRFGERWCGSNIFYPGS